MLGVGIDWAEQFHLVALGRPDEGVMQVQRIDHSPAAVADLITRIGRLEPDGAQVRVVLETRHGHLVEALADAGFTVLPINPDLVARRRNPARKKDDAEDARICCLIALDRHIDLRALIPHSQSAAELRAIARDDVRAQRDQRRLLNRLRADLVATFPAALQIADDDLDSPIILKLLHRWPTADDLAGAGRENVESFARSAHHGWPQRFADRVQQALAGEHFVTRDYLIRAKADTIRLTCAQLLLLYEQRKAWERRAGQLLLGGLRYGRDHRPRDETGPTVPGGKIYLSFPGLGDCLAARIAGEIGDIGMFPTPNTLQCYAGTAPVTRRSGKHDEVIARRLACNHFLRDAVHQWAFTSLNRSPWARQFYDAQRARGKRHATALRALGNRWLEILRHCLTNDTLYNTATHETNRKRFIALAA